MLSITDLLTTLSSPSTWPTSIWVLVFTATAYTGNSWLSRPSFPSKAPPLFDAWPIVGALRFFSNRKAFLEEVAGKSHSGQASFYYGKLRIVGLSGEDGRKMFFDSRELDIEGGYSTLFNAAPQVSNDERVQLGSKIRKSLVKFMRKENLIALTPQLVSDARVTISDLAARTSLTVDPFDDLYKLVYQLTMRTVGCTEIAGDPKLLAETLGIFESIEGASAGSKLLVPGWMTTPSHARRLWAGTKMYFLFKRIIDQREREGIRRDDPLQVLIDLKWEVTDIISVVIAALFAGQINSGYNAAWLLCYLGQNPRWRTLVREEVDTVIAAHRVSEDQSPADVLSTLTFDDWEVEFPVIDVALRETIRHTIVGCGFRQNNSGKDAVIGETGEIVPNGAFAVYLFDDTQMNPKIYTDPETWDPDRFLEGREEDKKLGSHGYIGWGSGRHPCLGIRFAKLEMAVMISMFVAHFDYHLVDAEGNPTVTTADMMDRSQHQVHRPTRPVFVKYEPRK